MRTTHASALDPEGPLREGLVRLDRRTRQLRSLTRRFLRDTVPPSPARPEAVSRLDREILVDVGRRHAHELDDLGWHGRSSQQRIVLQEPDLLDALGDPAAVDDILRLALRTADRAATVDADDRESARVAELVVGGWASMRASYWASASPNWRERPPLPSARLDALREMRTPPVAARPPSSPDAADLARARRAVDAAIRCLDRRAAARRRPTGRVVDPPGVHVGDQLHGDVDTAHLLDALRRLLGPAHADRLARSAARGSTSPGRMCAQSMEVMGLYDDLLDVEHGDHGRCLGYGLVSHALDARHLGAVLALRPTGPVARRLQRLLDAAADHALGSTADALVEARLRQCLQLVVDDRLELGFGLGEVRRALGRDLLPPG